MRILVFQHLAVEHPGYFRALWEAAGHQWVPVELDAGEPIPDLDGFDMLVAMGGPMDVWQEDIHSWLKPEKAAIRKWVQEWSKPYLGICLGHQLLASALGGRVGMGSVPEVGLSTVTLTEAGQEDPVLQGIPTEWEVFQWHGAAVHEVPAGTIVLAQSPACPVQAMRWGRYAYGFQFHVEITETTVPDWQNIPEYKASLHQALGAEGAARLAGDILAKLPLFEDNARRVNSNLLAQIPAPSQVAL